MHQGVNFSGDALGPWSFCPVANKNKDGRHVGLDFYDLLFETLRTPPMSDKAIYRQQFFCATPNSTAFIDLPQVPQEQAANDGIFGCAGAESRIVGDLDESSFTLTRTVIRETITAVFGLRRKFFLNNEFSLGRSGAARLPPR